MTRKNDKTNPDVSRAGCGLPRGFMPVSSDTSAAFEEAQTQLLREKPPAERLMTAVRLSDEVIRASQRAIARVHPELSADEAAHLFIEIHYGKELADAVREYKRGRGND